MDIHILTIHGTQAVLLNMNEPHRKLLKLLGDFYVKYYSDSGPRQTGSIIKIKAINQMTPPHTSLRVKGVCFLKCALYRRQFHSCQQDDALPDIKPAG